ncbi:TonB C-terminal domain-containing protein [Candidatus Dependentiae bacterium]|nr:TonB C-terminal domain-containing protein [Candidatus Dependentiae bacterium]
MNDSTVKKYLIGSLAAHVLIIVIGALLSHSTTIRHTFVVFGAHSKMPHKTLLKQFGNRTAAVPAGKAGANLQAARLPMCKQAAKKIIPQPKKAPIKKSIENIPAKKIAPAKPAPGVAFDNSKRSDTEKKKIVPAVQKKQVVPQKPDAKLDKKIVAQKKVQQKVPEKKLDKQEARKQESVKKELVPPQSEPSKPSQQEEFVTPLQATQALDELPEKTFQTEDGEQFFVGKTDQDNVVVAFTDREMLLYQRLVQQEIERTWQPPLGVPKGTECTVRFEVADNGSIKGVTLVRRSDILIFDLSTLRSARTCTFAQCLWGKIFQVDFRQ